MKKTFIVIVLVIAGFTVGAQDADKGDKKSNEIVKRLTEKTESYKSFHVEFVYKMQNVEAEIDESTDGVLTVMGNKYILNIAGQKVICDGETLWTYIEDAEEVQVNSLEDSEESISPSKLLTSYDKDYRSKFIREDFRYGTTVNIVDLTPIEGKSYYKVRLVIDKGKDQLLEITIFDKNGSTYAYVIKKFESDIDITDAAFLFNEGDYPGVDVIDMR